MTKIKTSAIIAISMAVGIVGGASATAITITIAQNQANMKAAVDHLVTADAYLAKANDNKGGHRVKARSLISLAITEVKAGIKVAN